MLISLLWGFVVPLSLKNLTDKKQKNLKVTFCNPAESHSCNCTEVSLKPNLTVFVAEVK